MTAAVSPTVDGLARASGTSAALGGVLWVAAVLVHAVRPEGCIGDACLAQPARAFGAQEGVLGLLAVLLVTPALLAVATRPHGPASRTTRLVFALCLTGAGLVVMAGLAQALLDDVAFMPFLVVPGLLCFLVGLGLLAAGALRQQLLPRWVGWFLLAAVVVALGGNEQTARVLLYLPLGAAWSALGGALAAPSRAADHARRRGEDVS